MSSSHVIPLLCDLVSIPSVNPMGRSAAGPPYFEGRISDYLEGFFRDLGVPYERRPVSAGRDNIIARYEPSDRARRTVLWDAHQDTVPVDGMTVEPFRPVREGDRIYGRGSCDVKGGMAAMLAAFARLVRDRPRGAARVVMACTVDEEYTHTGSSALARMELGADLAIAAEPTLLQVVAAHKGAVRWKVITRGVACHSSRPRDGVNAIYRMARVLSAIERHAIALSEAEPDPVLGPPSLSVGRIEGGQSVNIVPDHCAIEIDRRVLPRENTVSVRRDLERAILDQLGDTVPFEFTAPWVQMPPLSPTSAERWLPAVREALATSLGAPPPVSSVPYGTDAGPLSASGIPSLVFGPGDIAQAHTKDEWIDVDQLERGVDAYYALACQLGEADPG